MWSRESASETASLEGTDQLTSRDDKSDWPELRLMTSTGLPAMNVPGNEQAREPKGDEVRSGPEAFLMAISLTCRSSLSSHTKL
jgi:hypothetical protein